MARLVWTTEEMIVAASFADRLEWGPVNASKKEMIELSRILRRANFHARDLRDPDFRSVNSVALKVNNLRASHPSKTGKGLRVSKDEVDVVNAYVANPEMMRRVAGGILAAISNEKEEIGLAGKLLLKELAPSRLVIQDTRAEFKE